MRIKILQFWGHLEDPGFSREENELVEVILLCVDTLHHEVLVETCPFAIMSATTSKDVRGKNHVDTPIFEEMRANTKKAR